MAGLTWLPMNKKLLGILLNKAWLHLNPDGGVFLLETPRSDELKKNGINIKALVRQLQKAIEDVKYDPGNLRTNDPRYETGKIMITRNFNSPSTLPTI